MMSKADLNGSSVEASSTWRPAQVTPKQIQLVQETFERVEPLVDRAATLFYDHLFALDPSLQLLFDVELEDQGQKLMDKLALVVRHLGEPEQFMTEVRELGRRHVTYGVAPEHYQTMREALFWMLAQALGDAFNDEVAAAWAAAYGLLTDTMLAGAAEEGNNRKGA